VTDAPRGKGDSQEKEVELNLRISDVKTAKETSPQKAVISVWEGGKVTGPPGEEKRLDQGAAGRGEQRWGGRTKFLLKNRKNKAMHPDSAPGLK